jgi:O-methyltransferase
MLARIRSKVDSALLSSTARQVRQERLTYLAPDKLRRLDRAVGEALQATRQGDVVEFGLALGGSGVLLAQKARRRGRRFVGFDVFGMIPPPTSDKDDEKSKQRYEVIAAGKSEGLGGEVYYGYRTELYKEVCATFDRYGVPVDGQGVQLIQGLFQETWQSYSTDAVAFAHIDCDWYDPVKFCLEAVAEKLAPGGVMVLDDYNDYGGCRTAVDEFLAARPRYRLSEGLNPIIRRRD